jgi:N-methylhydantoinase B/oxoprolinase/acetone carboxylase alpha subunit
LQRPVDEVVADVREGYVSPSAARDDYGVVLKRSTATGSRTRETTLLRPAAGDG